MNRKSTVPSQKQRVAAYLEDELADLFNRYMEDTGLKAAEVVTRALHIFLKDHVLNLDISETLRDKIRESARKELRREETQVLIYLAEKYGLDPAEELAKTRSWRG